MNKEQELLLKDLCARLPYGVKMQISSWDDVNMEYVDKADTLYSISSDNHIRTSSEEQDYYIDEIKPYLFPMSSMTDEQRKEYDSIIYYNVELHVDRYYEVIDVDSFELLHDFYHKNHLDYRGLIPLGLAIDCTNLNIY